MNVERFWNKRGILNYCLLPFSFIYQLFMAVRRQFYRHNFKKSYRFVTPVIVVGNLSVGGTGKTPLVSTIAKWLREQGYRPGIVSRGYRGKSKHWPLWVDKDSNPAIVGDEAVMLARQTGCPMVVSPDRVTAVSTLLASNDCDIVLSDDGLQHYALNRQIEIAVLDGEKRHHNGFCLPAGPLRESPSRMREVDFIIANGSSHTGEYSMRINVGNIYALNNPELHFSPQQLQDKKLHAVAGIANPDRFFKVLESLGLQFEQHIYPDHHHFTQADIDFGSDAWVIMTEKDAVKCRAFAKDQHLCLAIEAVLDEQFFSEFKRKLNAL